MNWFDKRAFQYFLGCCAGLFGVALAIYLGYLLISEPNIDLADYIQLLILIFISGTMFVAIWTQNKREDWEQSSAYLERSIELMRRAFEVLSREDNYPKNDRISWVTAARLLQRAESISRSISVYSHQEIYESEKDYQRHRFNELLTIEGKSLPPEFFTGKSMIVGDLGKSAAGDGSGRVGDEWIPTRIVSVIYRFKLYPDNYDDPLERSSDLTQRELEKLWLFDHKGVVDYFSFRRQFFPAISKVFMRAEGQETREVTAEEINQYMPSLSGFYDDEA